MSVEAVLLIGLVLLLVGAMPAWSYSGSWGYMPSSVMGGLLVGFLVLLLAGRI